MNSLFIINRFYINDLICHKGLPEKIGQPPWVWSTFKPNAILELKSRGLGLTKAVFLQNNKGHLKQMPQKSLQINTPFIILDTIWVAEVNYIKVKYLTQLELFDTIYK